VTNKDLLVMLSDSGNITMVDFSLEKENEVVFKVVLNEGY
jgi:hypothetical protein